EIKNNSDAPFEGVAALDVPDQAIFQTAFGLYDGDSAVAYEIIEEQEESKLLVYVNLAANESKNLVARELGEGEQAPEFKKMTQAELWVKEGGEFVDNAYQGG